MNVQAGLVAVAAIAKGANNKDWRVYMVSQSTGVSTNAGCQSIVVLLAVLCCDLTPLYAVWFVQLLLQTWASDYSSHNKVLLFSHSTRCLDLLEVGQQYQQHLLGMMGGSSCLPVVSGTSLLALHCFTHPACSSAPRSFEQTCVHVLRPPGAMDVADLRLVCAADAGVCAASGLGLHPP